jgi:hypothetical protein
MRKAFKTRKSASMGTAVLASFNVERMVGASIQDGKSSSLSDTSGMLKHHETSRLESLERYWSERTALISSHHHRELAAAQSAVRQVLSAECYLRQLAYCQCIFAVTPELQCNAQIIQESVCLFRNGCH